MFMAGLKACENKLELCRIPQLSSITRSAIPKGATVGYVLPFLNVPTRCCDKRLPMIFLFRARHASVEVVPNVFKHVRSRQSEYYEKDSLSLN